MKGSSILEWALAATSATSATSATIRWRAADSSPPPTCVTGVHMIVARGSGEPAGLGRIGRVVGNVTLAIPGSDYTAVDYPATIAKYGDSLAKGTAAFQGLIRQYAEACPGTKVALLGYSQGAHAMMDTVCGSEQEGFQRGPGLDDAFRSQIIAIVAMGDPTHVPSAPWNRGTSQNSGFFPRPSIAGCEPYTPLIRGYCDTGDRYCDRGEDNKVHGSYFDKYTQDAVEFITENFLRAAANESSSAAPPPAQPSSASGAGAAPTSSVTTSAADGTSSTAVPTTLSTVVREPSATPSSTSVPASGSMAGPSALLLIAGVALSIMTLA